MGFLIQLPCCILAVGSLKSGPELELINKYQKRLKSLSIVELKASTPESEALSISKHIKSSDYCVALDEKGKDVSSHNLANLLLSSSKDYKRIVFIIGGADGLTDSIRQQAHLILSFGKLTWPHLFVRAMACEQIYRIHSILNDHPYHREG